MVDLQNFHSSMKFDHFQFKCLKNFLKALIYFVTFKLIIFHQINK